jgi:hypothetical protein
MKQEPTNARKGFGDIAPHLAELTDKVLLEMFGKIAPCRRATAAS